MEEANDSEYTSFEHTVVEAVLKVDSSGYLIKHPYINNALNRLLAKWHSSFAPQVVSRFQALPLPTTDSSVCTKAGRRRIGLAATGPGHQFGSVPEGSGCALPNPHVRRLASLHAGVHRRGGRPRHAGHRRAKRLLDGQRGSRGFVEKQIRLEGTFTLHSETAAKNGGDFDYDW